MEGYRHGVNLGASARASEMAWNLARTAEMNSRPVSWWQRQTKLPFAVLLVIAAYFLWQEHRAQVIEFLPWILVLGCVGMHLFMHGAHGHGGRHEHDESRGSSSGSTDEGGSAR